MDKIPSGMASFKKEDVILACNNTLKSINALRSKEKREYIGNNLKFSTWWWKNFWRWVSFGIMRKPTRRSAIKKYISEPSGCRITQQEDVECMYSFEECEIGKILSTLNHSQGDQIWLSTDAVAMCFYGVNQ